MLDSAALTNSFLPSCLLLRRKSMGPPHKLWGYRLHCPEGPRPSTTFTGDEAGHFRVKLSMAEAFTSNDDEFSTDQTCLAFFEPT